MRRLAGWVLGSENPSGVVYGVTVVGALLAAESALQETYAAALGSAALAVAALWLAHAYAGVLGRRLAGEGRLTPTALLHALRHDGAVLRGAAQCHDPAGRTANDRFACLGARFVRSEHNFDRDSLPGTEPILVRPLNAPRGMHPHLSFGHASPLIGEFKINRAPLSDEDGGIRASIIGGNPGFASFSQDGGIEWSPAWDKLSPEEKKKLKPLLQKMPK